MRPPKKQKQAAATKSKSKAPTAQQKPESALRGESLEIHRATLRRAAPGED